MKNITIIKHSSDLNNDHVYHKIICCSLSSFVQCKKTHSNVIHLGEILDLDQIYLKAYEQSHCLQFFKESQFNHLIKLELSENVLYDYFYCKLIANEMIHHFDTTHQFVIPTIKPYLTSIWIHHHQTELLKTSLLYVILQDTLLKHQYPVLHHNDLTKIDHQNFKLLNNFIQNQTKHDKNLNPCHNGLSSKISNLNQSDVLIDHWGTYLHRLISYPKMIQTLLHHNIKTTNICYRTSKIPQWKSVQNSIISTLVLNEHIYKGQSYGIPLTEFSKKEISKIIQDYTQHYITLKQTLLVHKPTIQHILFLHCFYIARNIIVQTHVYTKIFKKVQPKIYIGTDANTSTFQIAKGIAQSQNIITISYPHSPKLYIHDKNYYEYHTINLLNHLHGKHIHEILYHRKSHLIGISDTLYTKKPYQQKSKYTITIATRSWRGQYNSISFKPVLYHREFTHLMNHLPPNNNIIIKSHPNGDITHYYHLLQTDYPHIKYIPKGWKYNTFKHQTDILILFELPSFFAYALLSDIPIVLITGTMTRVLTEKLHYSFDDFPYVNNAKEAVKLTHQILHSQDAWKHHINKQRQFVKKNIPTHPEQNLVNLFQQLL